MRVEVVEVTEGTEEFQRYKEIRRVVFIHEQGISEDEEWDDTLHHRHFVAHIGDSTSIACCRLRKYPCFWKVERVACLAEYRRHGVSRLLVSEMVRMAEREDPRLLVVLHGQVNCLSFYLTMGFVAVSDEFYDEVNILHRTLIFPPTQGIRALSIWNDNVNWPENYLKGEVWDPVVRGNIKVLLKDIEVATFHPLVILQRQLSTEKVGKSLVDLFVKFALYVQEHQEYDGAKFNAPSVSLDTVCGQSTSDFLLSLSWGKLNTGHFSLVGEEWRTLYSCVNYVLAVSERNNPKKALLHCDRGLLMGRDLPGSSLSIFASFLHSSLPPPSPLSFSTLPISSCLPSSLPSSSPIPVVEDIEPEEFLDRFLIPGRPVVIRKAIEKWPAMGKWSFSYFLRECGHRTVPVEMGSKYTDDGWSQRLLTIRQFLQAVVHGQKVYLAQHRLFCQIPSLVADVSIPELCLCGSSSPDDVDMNIWLGPSDTVSPLHTDPRENVFCQVVGRKFVRLVAPGEEIETCEGILTNTSRRDAEGDFDGPCMDCEVGPGDALFIPRLWWHHVRSLTPSISVSFWFDL